MGTGSYSNSKKGGEVKMRKSRNPLWEPGLIPIFDAIVNGIHSVVTEYVAIPYGNRVLFQYFFKDA